MAKSALLLTNQLFRWSGSEVFLIEIAEELARCGWSVSIFSPDMDKEFAQNFSTDQITPIFDKENCVLEQFDLVYCQHQVLNFFFDQLIEAEEAGKSPFVVYGHLSPYNKLERPGKFVEQAFAFADLIICNSRETLNKMLELGLSPEKLKVFPNPAPATFFEIEPKTKAPRSLLAVSNHFPKEVRKALKIIEKSGVKVTRRGRQFKSIRVTPEDLQMHDMVLSIGKTVQYAFASKRPVYIYDKFGGPGWLTAENFRLASEFNFSGRCVHRKLDADALSQEILSPPFDLLKLERELDELRQEYMLTNYVTDYFIDPVLRRDVRKVRSFSPENVSEFHSEIANYFSKRHKQSKGREAKAFSLAKRFFYSRLGF